MQETRNNCFGSKICSTTLRQTKTGKHECRTLLLYFGIRAYMFSPDEVSCYIFSTQNNCCEFLASYGIIIQSIIQSLLKTAVCVASLSYIMSCHVMHIMYKMHMTPNYSCLCFSYRRVVVHKI